MKQHVTRHISFLRATAIGGIFFLLPLVVIGMLIGQVGQVVFSVATIIQPYLHQFGLDDATGYVLTVGIAITLIVLACFVSGMLASRSLAQKFVRSIEKYLLMLFPRYAIFKEQLSGNIGGEISKNKLQPVWVNMQDHIRIAFEVERAEAAWLAELPTPHAETVTVYLPGSPDPWSGQVINVLPDQITPIPIPLPDVLGAFEKLGIDSQRVLCGIRPQ